MSEQSSPFWWKYLSFYKDLDHMMYEEDIPKLLEEQQRRDWEEFRELTWKEKEEIGKVLDTETDERSRLVLLAEDTGIDIVLDMIDAKIAELRKKTNSL